MGDMQNVQDVLKQNDLEQDALGQNDLEQDVQEKNDKREKRGNRQLGLDGRVFINDCLAESVFFIYSIILCGFFGAIGDIMKLTGKSAQGMDEITNGLVIMDLICSLGMIVVAYYIYFMNCGKGIPKLETKPLIVLECIRAAYYALLAYFVVYRLIYDLKEAQFVFSIFYLVYLAWICCCILAAMFLLTLLWQNSIRRSYEQSFKRLSLVGLCVNLALPIFYLITRIWISGHGDGFYSAGFCDFIRLCVSPVFYIAVWFVYMNAIDQVRRIFDEVDGAIKHKQYQIELEGDEDYLSDLRASVNSMLREKKKKSMKNRQRDNRRARSAFNSAKNAEAVGKRGGKKSSSGSKPSGFKFSKRAEVKKKQPEKQSPDKASDETIKSAAINAEEQSANVAATQEKQQPVQNPDVKPLSELLAQEAALEDNAAEPRSATESQSISTDDELRDNQSK